MNTHHRTPAPGLFRDVALAPDRDRDFAPKPVVSVHPDDEPAYHAEIETRAVTQVDLYRRGIEFGSYAICSPEGLIDPRPRKRRREALVRERWIAGRPLLFPEAFADVASRVKGLARGMYDRLARGEFATWLKSRESALGARYMIDELEAELADPERDEARATFKSRDGLDGFWIKLAKLSTHELDGSKRLRMSFGEEGDDDASTDDERQRALVDLARPLIPGFREVLGSRVLEPLLKDLTGGDVLLTQPIGYWNTAHGGARFHHDSFAENDGQLGVLFVQLTGRSFWLALSIRDLVERVREFVGAGELAAEDEVPDDDMPVDEAQDDADVVAKPSTEVAEKPTSEPSEFGAEIVALCADSMATLAEAALPDCGRLNEIVNSPSFAAFLADAGHAVLLEPGDAILLPNHGLERTVMHSVFGVARRAGYGLSLAIRRG